MAHAARSSGAEVKKNNVSNLDGVRKDAVCLWEGVSPGQGSSGTAALGFLVADGLKYPGRGPG